MKKIAIIGNGISGITAARHIRKMSDDEITVISAETDHFFSRTALMYIYMGHMKYEHTKPYEDWFWEKNRINLRRDFVEKVDTDSKKLKLRSGEALKYDVLIISCGSAPNKFGWPGQDLKGVQGLYSYQDLENMEHYTKDVEKAVVVGGGLIGIEMTEMLLSRNIGVTFLVREPGFWYDVLPPEESEMVGRHIKNHNVDLRINTELKEILPGKNGRAQTVITTSGEEIPCGFVGLATGVHPGIAFLKDSKIETDRGIFVNEYLQTNIADVYAIGDCAQHRNPPPGRKPIEQVWYTGRIQGETAAYNICGIKTAYQPGIWFNSAKFFDIEYQTYGDVKNRTSDDEDCICWQHGNGEKSVRIVYDKAKKHVKGFNLLGIRYRQEVCERWIRDRTPIDDVLRNLKKANFDPEFYRAYENEVVAIYNNKHPEKPVKTGRSKNRRSIFASVFS